MDLVKDLRYQIMALNRGGHDPYKVYAAALRQPLTKDLDCYLAHTLMVMLVMVDKQQMIPPKN